MQISQLIIIYILLYWTVRYIYKKKTKNKTVFTSTDRVLTYCPVWNGDAVGTGRWWRYVKH